MQNSPINVCNWRDKAVFEEWFWHRTRFYSTLLDKSQKQDSERVTRKDKSVKDPFSLLLSGTHNGHVGAKLTFPGNVCFRAHALQSLIHAALRSFDIDIRG